MKEAVSNSAFKDDQRPIINSAPFTGLTPSVITDTKKSFNFAVGDFVMERGVYAGRLDEIQISKQDNTLVGPFHLFAMPKDIPAYCYRSSTLQLKNEMYWSFNNAAHYLADLKNEQTPGCWGVIPPSQGRMGCPDLNLRDSLLDYNKNNRGRWALPSLEMLKILCEHQDRGAFADSFLVNRYQLRGAMYLSGQRYWSFEHNGVRSLHFRSNIEGLAGYYEKYYSLRLIRLEPDPECTISWDPDVPVEQRPKVTGDFTL